MQNQTNEDTQILIETSRQKPQVNSFMTQSEGNETLDMSTNTLSSKEQTHKLGLVVKT